MRKEDRGKDYGWAVGGKPTQETTCIRLGAAHNSGVQEHERLFQQRLAERPRTSNPWLFLLTSARLPPGNENSIATSTQFEYSGNSERTIAYD